MATEIHNLPIQAHIDYAQSLDVSTEIFDSAQLVSLISSIPLVSDKQSPAAAEPFEIPQGPRPFSMFNHHPFKGSSRFFTSKGVVPSVDVKKLREKVLGAMDEIKINHRDNKRMLALCETMEWLSELLEQAYNGTLGILEG